MTTTERSDNRDQGQTLVEFALILPILLLLIFGIIDFGRALFTYAQASNSLRDSLRYAAITGVDATPNYRNCTAIANIAEDRIWFASNVDYKITYDVAPVHDPPDEDFLYEEGGPMTCPGPDVVDVGDLLTVETTTTVDLVAPIISSIVPQLTFTLGGTRTLTGEGFAYGAGVDELGPPGAGSVTPDCGGTPPGEWLDLSWAQAPSTANFDEYWIYGDTSTYPIAKILRATAESYPGAGTAGCTGLPGTAGSCHDDPADFGDSSPHTYQVRAYSNDSGLGPATSVGPLSCPVPSAPSKVENLALVDSYCGFGEFIVDLSWDQNPAAPDGVVEYHVYKDGVQVGTIEEPGSAPVTCTDSSPVSTNQCNQPPTTWDGSPGNYTVKAFNGVESTNPSDPVPVLACTGLSTLYLQDSGALADDSNTVPGVADFSTAMNITCGSAGATYTMTDLTTHHWLTRPFTAADTLSAGGYTFTVEVDSNPAPKTMTYDIILSVCDIGGNSCTTGGTGTYTFSGTDTDGNEVSIPINVPADVPINANDRLRLTLDNTATSGGNPTFGIGVGGACGGGADSRLVFP